MRVIGDDGSQVGVMQIDDALKYAQERDLDLVEVAPESKPPVCRVLDYSKYKYELAQKQKAARKHQKQIVIREIKFRPKIAEHDYATKKGHVQRFLRHRDKVKITIMFRGREQSHPERGKMILDRLASELEDLAQIEQRPNLEGRNMTMVLGPSKAVLKGDFDDKPGGEAPADGEAVAERGRRRSRGRRARGRDRGRRRRRAGRRGTGGRGARRQPRHRRPTSRPLKHPPTLRLTPKPKHPRTLPPSRRPPRSPRARSGAPGSSRARAVPSRCPRRAG